MTYYVDISNGSDSNAGTSEALAWGTIAKVNATSFSAGDQILFKCGEIWREQLTVPSSGSASGFITFGSYGTGSKPVISGANLMSIFTDQGGSVWRASLTSDPINVDFDDVTGTEKSTLGELATYKDWHWDGSYLYVYTSSPYLDTIEAFVRTNCIRAEGKSFVIYEDLHITKSRVEGLFHSAYGSTATDVIIQRLTVNRTGIGLNTKESGFANGISLAGSRMIVQDCDVYDCDWNGITFGPPSNGNSTDILIQRNRIYGNWHNGIDFKNMGTYTLSYVRIFNNRIYDNLGTQSNGIFSQIISGGCDRVYVFGNFVKGNYRQGIALTANSTYYITNLHVYNNTITANGDIGLQLHQSGAKIYNNIIAGNNTNSVSTKEMKIYDEGVAATTDYNLFYKSGQTAVIGKNNDDAITLAAYQALGQEANGANADPLFDADYEVSELSPCYEAGYNVGIAFRSRPFIGCYDGSRLN